MAFIFSTAITNLLWSAGENQTLTLCFCVCCTLSSEVQICKTHFQAALTPFLIHYHACVTHKENWTAQLVLGAVAADAQHRIQYTRKWKTVRKSQLNQLYTHTHVCVCMCVWKHQWGRWLTPVVGNATTAARWAETPYSCRSWTQ